MNIRQKRYLWFCFKEIRW